jgi:hypothetical protein
MTKCKRDAQFKQPSAVQRFASDLQSGGYSIFPRRAPV